MSINRLQKFEIQELNEIQQEEQNGQSVRWILQNERIEELENVIKAKDAEIEGLKKVIEEMSKRQEDHFKELYYAKFQEIFDKA